MEIQQEFLVKPDKGKRLAQIEEIQDIEWKKAQVPLWNLARCDDLTDADRRHLSRFLDAKNSDNFSAAVECLWQSDDAEIWKKLRSFLSSPEHFRVRRIAVCLYWRGDDSELNKLSADLRNPQTPPERRRLLAGDLLMAAPRALAPVYIDLLADSEKWIRYVCSKELALVFDQDFPFDHLNPQNNDAAIKKWREWHQSNKTLISKKYEAKKAATGIGASVELASDGLKIIKPWRGFPAAEAGIQSGDKIMAVNGILVSKRPVREILRYELSGKAGAPVKLRVKKAATGQEVEMELLRRELSWTSDKGPGPFDEE